MSEWKIKLNPYQDEFLFSKAKFPCLCAGIGTGKTAMLLIRIYQFCEKHPNTNALICRKEFTDLRDSTMADFEEYFGVKIRSDKNFLFENGSKIMFRHASELDVLKNINLAIAAIEQAEEFEDETTFNFIRDRLRQQNGADKRRLCVIANADGHNWVWKLWFNNPPSEEYHGVTANSFDNEHNLPQDFVNDLRAMEQEAPNHFLRMVMNSFEVTDEDDFVFTQQELEAVRELGMAVNRGYGIKVSGFDIARYGEDKNACVELTQCGALKWRVTHVDQWSKKDLNWTTGNILAITNQREHTRSKIDADGLGSGPFDTLNKGRKLDNFKSFRNIRYSRDENEDFANPRTAYAFKLKRLVEQGHIQIEDDELIEELLTLKFDFDHLQRRRLVSKEKMRKDGIKSPNLADALIYAVSLIGEIRYDQDNYYRNRRPQYSKEEDLLATVGR